MASMDSLQQALKFNEKPHSGSDKAVIFLPSLADFSMGKSTELRSAVQLHGGKASCFSRENAQPEAYIS